MKVSKAIINLKNYLSKEQVEGWDFYHIRDFVYDKVEFRARLRADVVLFVYE
jgi:hypothetical protein